MDKMAIAVLYRKREASARTPEHQIDAVQQVWGSDVT
jgi:hypothetical protein